MRLVQLFLAVVVGLTSAGHIAAGLWTGRIWPPESDPRSPIAWSAHPSAYMLTLVVLAIILVGSSANVWSLLKRRRHDR